ncbi:MAG: acyl-CoA synthetase [Solirubrobacterales bacterium]|nr:acyl-CoA synthetase [Solirubrobacterales bacterium]
MTRGSRGATVGNPSLLPALAVTGEKEALRFGERALNYGELRAVAAQLAGRLRGAGPVAVWAEPALETCAAVVGALVAGAPIVPINPKSGERELSHIVKDSEPAVVLAAPDTQLPPALAALERVDVDVNPRSSDEMLPAEPDPEAPALVVYTSGTTGPPKGVVLPRRALSTNLDALAEAWRWTESDVLTQGLPLFHVHGLVLGVLGPLRRGGTLHHLGSFSIEGVAAELAGSATMLFGVPTMYHRLAEAAEGDPLVARALAGARLLVSGSAALSTADHERIERATGQRVVERYGMTETLMNCAVRADGDRRPGTVGPPVGGVQLRLVDDDGSVIEAGEGETVGEIRVRGPNLFPGYLTRPDATENAFREGWFCTGDVATRDPDGYIRLIGRQATDLINSGGFKIGAGEIEAALLDHPGISEAAITGEPDPDLGERIVAWIVPAGDPPPSENEVADHVAALLAPHKRPREVRYLTGLPRNELGKVMKNRLG